MDYFGLREVCNVTLRSLRNIPACRSMTGKDIKKGEPVMYFDYLKVSNISGTVATVYATGGRGNTRRLSWDGDKEITFHIEDALISPTSMAILMAAQLVKRKVLRKDIVADGVENGSTIDQNIIILPESFDKNAFMSWGIIEVNTNVRLYSKDLELIFDPTLNDGKGLYTLIVDSKDLIDSAGDLVPITSIDRLEILTAVSGRTVYKHEKYTITAIKDGELEIKHIPKRDSNHPLFIFDVHDDGSIDLISEIQKDAVGGNISTAIDGKTIKNEDIYEGNDYIVDYYREVKGNVTSLVVTADGTSDYFKLEGETLMRREKDGMDVPVVITIPKVRPRAQFEIPMSSTGDPATFAFDFDVFPARDSTYESCNDNVMVIMDIIEDDEETCNCVYDSLNLD